MSQWLAGAHGTTYGGNPIACAAALATLQVIREENLLENARKMGKRFLDGLSALKKKYPVIGEVRGLGLMLAMEFIHPNTDKHPNPEVAFNLLNAMLDQGLVAYMAGTYGQVVRYIPPLIVTAEQVDEALAITEKGLAQVAA